MPDVDKITRWQVTPPKGHKRTFATQTEADTHHDNVGGKVGPLISWRVRYRIDGRSREKWFATKPAANRFAVTNAADLARGVWIDPRGGQRTFRDYAEDWRHLQLHAPGSADYVEGQLRRHVYPAIGDTPLAKLRTSTIQALVRGVTGRLAPGTVGIIYGYVATICTAAVNDGLIARTPCINISLPAAQHTRLVPWPVDKVTALADSIGGRYRALIGYTAATGVRQGEAFGLTLSQLHMLERTVDVAWQIQPIRGQGLVMCRPKTPASQRTIPLADTTLAALAAHMAEYPPVQVDIVHRERDGSVFTAPEQIVFTNTAGKPLRRSHFNTDIWKPAVTPLGGGTMHQLRHFYASLLIRRGLSPTVVQARLGHASIVETYDTYGHLWPDDDDRTRQAIDTELGITGTSGSTAINR